jgi:hypothetical protein
MLIAMTGAAQTRPGLTGRPRKSVDFLDCRLKTANVSRQGLTD